MSQKLLTDTKHFGQQLFCQRNISRMVNVFFHGKQKIERKRRNGKRRAAGIADGKQSILPSILTDQHQIRPCICGIFVLEGIVSAKHLISRIKGIQGLLTPRTIHIVLHHTQFQGIDACIINTAVKLVLDTARQDFDLIDLRQNTCVLQLNGLCCKDLQIATSQA